VTALAAIPIWFALGVVGLAGVYLLSLGLAAIWRPAAASAFLLGFAASAPVHFLELAVRVLIGVCLLAAASSMPYANLFWFLGAVLVATSLPMVLVPWRVHRRFAEWVVPPALRHLGVIGVSSLAGGAFFLACASIGATT
jgi:hypothetical protein